MSSEAKSRRAFLISSATGLNAAWVAANLPGIVAAQDQAQQAVKGHSPKLTFFNEAQAAEVEAMTAQIIPTDQDPGALLDPRPSGGHSLGRTIPCLSWPRLRRLRAWP